MRWLWRVLLVGVLTFAPLARPAAVAAVGPAHGLGLALMANPKFALFAAVMVGLGYVVTQADLVPGGTEFAAPSMITQLWENPANWSPQMQGLMLTIGATATAAGRALVLDPNSQRLAAAVAAANGHITGVGAGGWSMATGMGTRSNYWVGTVPSGNSTLVLRGVLPAMAAGTHWVFTGWAMSLESPRFLDIETFVGAVRRSTHGQWMGTEQGFGHWNAFPADSGAALTLVVRSRDGLPLNVGIARDIQLQHGSQFRFVTLAAAAPLVGAGYFGALTDGRVVTLPDHASELVGVTQQQIGAGAGPWWGSLDTWPGGVVWPDTGGLTWPVAPPMTWPPLTDLGALGDWLSGLGARLDAWYTSMAGQLAGVLEGIQAQIAALTDVRAAVASATATLSDIRAAVAAIPATISQGITDAWASAVVPTVGVQARLESLRATWGNRFPFSVVAGLGAIGSCLFAVSCSVATMTFTPWPGWPAITWRFDASAFGPAVGHIRSLSGVAFYVVLAVYALGVVRRFLHS